jgi:hypothetical protein
MIDEEFRCDVCDISAERDRLKAERDELMEFIKKSPVAFGQDADHNDMKYFLVDYDFILNKIQEADK